MPLLLECARAALRAQSASELASTVCDLLERCGDYAEASIVFPPPDPTRAPDAAHVALASPPAADPPSGGDCISLPLEVGGAAAVLCLRTAAGRIAEEHELVQLGALAADVAHALTRLHAEARRRALASSERRLRETFEHAGVGITRIDMDGRFIEVNQKFCEMLGYTREALIGRATHEVTVPGDYGPGAAFRAQARLGQATVSVAEKRYLRKDGTHVWARRTMSPAYDESGTVHDVISVVEDITERKRIENELREYVERFELAGRATSDAVWDWDIAAGTLWWGEGLEKLFDYRRERIGSSVSSWTSRIHPDELERIEASVRSAVDGAASSWAAEYRFRRADGTYADVYDRAYIMRDESGRARRVIGAIMDISQRKRAERERAMEHAVATVLSESRSVEETMPRLLGIICRAMGWAYGARWVGEAATARIHRADWWSEVELDFDPADRARWLELGPVASGQGLLRSAWHEGRPKWLADIAKTPDFRRRHSAAKLGLRSAIAFPILAHDERVGVMEFFGREVCEPDAGLLQTIGAVASQIGQFVRRKQAEDSLQESEQQLRAMFDTADVGISMTGLDLRFLRVNDKHCAILGYTREELLRMSVTDVNLPENVGALIAYREGRVRGDQPEHTREKQLVRKDGTLVWVSMASSLVRASDGAPRCFIAVIQDISESKRAAAALKESEAQFRQLAHYDSLTHLPNRSLFYDRLGHGIAQARRNGWTLAVLFIDVDRFKHVNDTFGHTAGDELLKRISERLMRCVRRDDTVGRLSGDEFAIVLSSIAAPEDAGSVAQKIVDALNEPFQLDGAELFVSVSIGITVFPGDSDDQDTLIRNADVAMYRAKERGRNNFQFFTPEMNHRTREMLSMESELRRAIERNEFVMHYQPKVSLATGRVTGVEALLRWRHPERGLVAPGDFIPLLEETGLIVQAGEWVLQAVCTQIRAWESSGVEPVAIAINLSARQFLARDLAGTIDRVLRAHRIRPGLVEVEITESAIMTNADEAIRTLEYLQSIGVQTAVDDFGTGYSSLGYLKRFPLRALKIDRSFVRDITTDPDDATITHAVISMAHSLHLKVIAEGVETEAQLRFLKRYGCDEVQGYLYSKPLPADECAAFIAGERR